MTDAARPDNACLSPNLTDVGFSLQKSDMSLTGILLFGKLKELALHETLAISQIDSTCTETKRDL